MEQSGRPFLIIKQSRVQSKPQLILIWGIPAYMNNAQLPRWDRSDCLVPGPGKPVSGLISSVLQCGGWSSRLGQLLLEATTHLVWWSGPAMTREGQAKSTRRETGWRDKGTSRDGSQASRWQGQRDRSTGVRWTGAANRNDGDGTDVNRIRHPLKDPGWEVSPLPKAPRAKPVAAGDLVNRVLDPSNDHG